MRLVMMSYIFALLLPLGSVAQEISDEEDLGLMTQLHELAFWTSCKRFNITSKEALNDPGKIHPMVLKYYRQTERKLIDPIADYALTHPVRSNFTKAIHIVVGIQKVDDLKEVEDAKACAQVLFGIPPEEEPILSEIPAYSMTLEYQEDKRLLEKVLERYSENEKEIIRAMFEAGEIVFESNLSPIDPSGMASHFIQIMQEEESKGLVISEGEQHKWSSGFKSNQKMISLKTIPSKLLTTLSTGRSSGLLVTGKEKDLKSFISSGEDASLRPEDLFRKSLQLNNGNVYMTLMTIENTLSEYWIHPRRSELNQTKKLKPLARNFGNRSDVFGHWYHLFGMVLYGYAEGPNMAMIAGKIESIGSLIISKFKGEKQENKINLDGGRVGSHLNRYMKNKKRGKPYTFQLKNPSSDDREDLLKKKINRALKKMPAT